MVAEYVHVIIEIGQQDEVREVLEWAIGISRQPIFDDFLFRFHSFFVYSSAKLALFDGKTWIRGLFIRESGE